MEYFVIAGGQPLAGEITLAGSKNLASKLMIASLLSTQDCQIENVPLIGENQLATRILELAGASLRWAGTTVTVQAADIKNEDLSTAPRNRLPILVAAPLLFRVGRVRIPEPGGDKIGNRPVNFHLSILERLGATVTKLGGYYDIEASKLSGTTLKLPFPSVGATETALMAGVWAQGTTQIHGAAIEPEVLELVRYLNQMGARIRQVAEREFCVVGVSEFHGATQRVISDRIEAVSYLALALASRGSVVLHQAAEAKLGTYLKFLNVVGAQLETDGESLRCWWDRPLRGQHVVTGVHPGFMTDWQQPTTILLLTATGESVIHETVHERRFGYVQQLNTMGAGIEVQDAQTSLGDPPFQLHARTQQARLHGPVHLHPATLTMPDLRAGMAYVMAALIAEGESTVYGVEQVDRGYEQIETKLRSLGAQIERRQD